VAFRARHHSCAGVPRHFDRIACAFAVRAIGPWAGQLTVLVTVLGAGFHSAHATYFLLSAQKVSRGTSLQ
jgi:hypothetical protein